MPFTRDWSVTTPIDHTLNSSWPDYDRRAKVDVSDRLATIISGFASGETALGVLKLPFIAGSAPSTVTDQYQLYGKVVGTKTLLHGKDEDGTESMIVGLRTGDILLSSNTTTPPDFTDVSSTYANKMIRISATALSTGGSDTLSGTTDSTTLTAAQSGLPAHTHTVSNSNGGGGGAGGPHAQRTDNADLGGLSTGSTGGSAASSGHTHTLTSISCVNAYVTLKAYQKN